jgi:hypothetical protein
MWRKGYMMLWFLEIVKNIISVMKILRGLSFF